MKKLIYILLLFEAFISRAQNQQFGNLTLQTSLKLNYATASTLPILNGSKNVVSLANSPGFVYNDGVGNFSYEDPTVTFGSQYEIPVTNATSDDFNYGTFYYTGANFGVNVTPTANAHVKGSLTTALTGTVSVTAGTASVTGSGTAFTTELVVGDAIMVGSEVFTVSVIGSATSLTLDSNHSAGASGVTAYTDSNLLVIDNGDGVSRLSITKSNSEVFGRGFASSSNTNYIFRILGSSSNAIEFGALTNSPFGTYIQSGGSSIYPLLLNPRGGSVGISTSSPDRLLHAEVSDAVTSAVTYTQRHSHISSGTPATNFGVGEEYELESASGTNRVAASQDVIWSDATNASEDATYKLNLMAAGSIGTRLTLESTGGLTLNGYTSSLSNLMNFSSSGAVQRSGIEISGQTLLPSTTGELRLQAGSAGPYLSFFGDSYPTIPNFFRFITNGGTVICTIGPGNGFAFNSSSVTGFNILGFSGATPSIKDGNSNEIIRFPTAITDAVNELTITNAASSNSPEISATGDNTDINIRLTPKGSGYTYLTSGNLRMASATSLTDVNGNEWLEAPTTVASAINHAKITNSATGDPVILSATGDDTNISWRLNTKGTGGFGYNVTPLAWSTSTPLVLGYAGTGITGFGVNDTKIMANAYFDSSWKFAGTGYANLYEAGGGGGSHSWYTSTASGTAGNAITFNTVMSISSSGNVTIPIGTLGLTGTRVSNIFTVNQTTTNAESVDSDSTLKANIHPIINATEKIKQLNPVEYTWKVDTLNKVHYGLIAQDVEKVLKEVVTKREETGTLGVTYTELIPYLIEAFKESESRISMLEKENKELKSKLTELIDK